jgi:hypothetical protein
LIKQLEVTEAFESAVRVNLATGEATVASSGVAADAPAEAINALRLRR